jgi:hypothetical protein
MALTMVSAITLLVLNRASAGARGPPALQARAGSERFLFRVAVFGL